MDEIYTAPRGQNFKDFVLNFALMGNTDNKKIIESILSKPEAMKVMSQAFTSKKANETENYEVFEQMGDVTVGKFLIWYTYHRFPQLFCPDGVKIAARLKINLGAKTVLASIAEKYGFWMHITSTRKQRSVVTERTDLLEDTFEAMIGGLEFLFVKYTSYVGVGYEIIYKILQTIFDMIDISLKYEDLIDAKTRLKEMYDRRDEDKTLEYEFTKIGGLGISTLYEVPKINFENIRVPREQAERLKEIARRSGISIVDKSFHKMKTKLAEGTATDKKAAEMEAANKALTVLEARGVAITRENPYKCLEPQFSF